MSNGYFNRIRLREKLKKDLEKIKKLLSMKRSGALNTGYSLEELEKELQRRDKVLERFQSKAERNRKKARKYYREAEKAVNSRKVRLFGQGKQHAIRESLYSDLTENLLVQQLFLENLVAEAKRKEFFDNQMGEVFGIDIGELNQEAIGDAMHRSEVSNDKVAETIGDVYIDMEVDDEDRIVPNVEELREQAHAVDGSDKQGSPEIARELNDSVDDKIEDELNRLDKNAEQERVADGGVENEDDGTEDGGG
jgi:hypothetical protein